MRASIHPFPPDLTPRVLKAGLIATFALALTLLPARPAAATPIVTVDLTGPAEPADLVSALVGAGVTTSNVTYVGAESAAGTFSGGDPAIGFNSGIILSSGEIAGVVGPNADDATTTQQGTAGDTDLDTLSAVTTFDAAVLEFDFVPDADEIFFSYVFSSEEYNEYVNSAFNDVFGFFVNGTNCATVEGGDPVTINTINNGNPLGTDATHPELYRNNDLDDGGGSIETEMDGLTVVLTCSAAVNAGGTNHMKLAIADGSDDVLDSNVFLQAGSFSTTPPSPCGPMDVAFVIDDTGSMGPALDNVKSEAASLLTQIDAASGGSDQLALVSFKDSVTVTEDLALGNEAAVSAGLAALVPFGGAFAPEASDESLNTVVNGLDAADRLAGQQNGDFDGVFRAAAVKIVILVTDALPGGFDDTFTAGVDDVNAHA
ncbi:MAG: choice-of-anchor L domain-containing protein, partial [Candidatus Limnocylindria bacterium]